MRKANTDGFRMLPSYYEAIRDLPDEDRLRLYDAILDRGFGNEVEELPPVLAGFFLLIEPTLEKSTRYFEKQRANGSRPKTKKPDEASESQTEANGKRESESDSEGDSESECECEGESALKPQAASKRFVPPSAEEIAAYCAERGNGVDASQFADYYAARGWRVGSGTMTVWRAAVRTWERRNEERGESRGDRAGAARRGAAGDFVVRYDNAPPGGGTQ